MRGDKPFWAPEGSGCMVPHMVRDTYVEDILDTGALARVVDERWVTATTNAGATIYNYTRAAMYKGHWTPETSICRGLIVASDGKVLARPFPKFFNPGERSAPPIPDVESAVEVTDKLDGSLGIGYRHPDGQWRISTRGSMVSRIAIEATRIWKEKYSGFKFGPGLTPLFEIIYPQNRIVVDYKETRELVLLAVLDIATGADFSLRGFGWPGPVAATRPFGSLRDLTEHMAGDRPSADLEEGYVIRFDLGPNRPHLRYKLKWPHYVYMHRMVAGLTTQRVWVEVAAADCRRRGMSPKGVARLLRLSPEAARAALDPALPGRSVIPEEFLEWYDATAASLTKSALGRTAFYERLVARAVGETPDGAGARGFAETVLRLKGECGADASILFSLAKKHPVGYGKIWREIAPSGDDIHRGPAMRAYDPA